MMPADKLPFDCRTFEAQLSDYLEGGLDDAARAAMDAHRAGCSHCSKLVAELDAIVADAGALPLLSPPHDLWSGIEARIATPVVTLDRGSRRATAMRMLSMRSLAAAALLLVTVSSGVTWMLTRSPVSSATQAAPATVAVAPSAPAAAIRDTIVTPTTATVPRTPAVSAPATATAAARGREVSTARLASRAGVDVDRIYEREIRAMRRIVDERMIDLDSATIAEVERNLAIIDKAILDNRRALERDPRSRFLSTQLDRALENKLAIMRRVALL